MTEPKVIAAGKFTVYETPSGGIHVTMLLDGSDEPRHFDAPPLMVRMLKKRLAAGDTPEEMVEGVGNV
jgi:hypothetical protein